MRSLPITPCKSTNGSPEPILSMASSCSAGQVLGEELEDPPPRVLGGSVVIAQAGHVQQRREQRPGVEAIEEAVAGLRVLLDVMQHAGCLKRPLEPRCATAQAAVLGAVAPDHGACAGEALGGGAGH